MLLLSRIVSVLQGCSSDSSRWSINFNYFLPSTSSNLLVWVYPSFSIRCVFSTPSTTVTLCTYTPAWSLVPTWMCGCAYLGCPLTHFTSNHCLCVWVYMWILLLFCFFTTTLYAWICNSSSDINSMYLPIYNAKLDYSIWKQLLYARREMYR